MKKAYVLGSAALLACLFAFQNCGKLNSKPGAADTLASSADPAGGGPSPGGSPQPLPSPTPGAPAAAPYVFQNLWKSLPSIAGTPSARWMHATVWTGSKMIVWGGSSTGQVIGTELGTGSIYDPATGIWAPISTVNAPTPRTTPVAVWTGTRMIVWGGISTAGVFGSGASYDPVTDTWTPIASLKSASTYFIYRPAGVWTGSKMLVWSKAGTTVAGGPFTFYEYDPATDTWSAPFTTASVASSYQYSKAVWTGTEMLIYDGLSRVASAYNPATQTLRSLSATGIPETREWASVGWTGSKMIVYGGLEPMGTTNTYYANGAALGFTTAGLIYY